MVRAAGILLLGAVVTLLGSAVFWLIVAVPSSAAPGEPSVLLERLAREPAQVVDLGGRYAGRLELVDPTRTLPTWHLHSREEAARIYAATRTCPPQPLSPPVLDAALRKAYAWHLATCAGRASVPNTFVAEPPFVHPSGRSYALLGRREGRGLEGDEVRALHLLELPTIDVGALDAEAATLAALGVRALTDLGRGERLALTKTSFVYVDDVGGARRIGILPRSVFERHAEAASLALRPRVGECHRPASATLCWEPVPRAERHRTAMIVATSASGALAVASGIGLLAALARERRRAHADRVLILRTLTHELRTPAMSLALDVEPLTDAYDELPSPAQDAALRIAEGTARLNRILHRSARYLALFEAGTPRADLARERRLPSVRAFFDEARGEWERGNETSLSLVHPDADAALTTDPDWLAVALRNLVENAFRHGTPPIVVAWTVEDVPRPWHARRTRDGRALVVRVSDAGSTPSLSLRRATLPFRRGPSSAGLGLGLAIVDRAVRLLGGTLSHVATPTAFVIRIPLRSDAEGAA